MLHPLYLQLWINPMQISTMIKSNANLNYDQIRCKNVWVNNVGAFFLSPFDSLLSKQLNLNFSQKQILTDHEYSPFLKEYWTNESIPICEHQAQCKYIFNAHCKHKINIRQTMLLYNGRNLYMSNALCSIGI